VSKQVPRRKPLPPSKNLPFWDYWVQRILGLPRLWRLVFVVLSSLALVAVIFPAVDYIYLERFFSVDTRILPSLVSAVAMLLMYGGGYILLVGWRGEVPRARRIILAYALLGFLMMGIAIGLIVYGLSLSAGAPETF
jgi:hypothetical protein